MSKVRATILICAAIFAMGLTACGRTVSVSFSPDTTTVLHNPLSGWVMYLGRSWDDDFWEKEGYDAMPASDGTQVRVSDYATTAYIRTSWSSLEPEEGVYAWRDPESRIYRLFKTVQDRGLRLAFRILVDGRDQGQNTPLYVIEAGAQYYNSGAQNHHSPYPDDPVFQEKYSKFIKALAEDFNDPDKVDFIDAFGLGKWGESHGMIYKDESNKKKVFDWVTDLYSSTFTKVPLVVHYHRLLAGGNGESWGDVSPDTEELLQMALDRGYSLRHDAFAMHGYYQEWEENYAEAHKFQRPIIMEGGWITAAHHRYWIDPSGKYREGHSEDVRREEFETSRQAHVNMMDFRINDEVRSWFGQCFDLVKRFNAEGGYRLYPDEITFDDKISRDGELRISHRWNNLGWGYCPNNIPQWNYRYKVAFALLDKEDEPVRIYVDEKAEPSVWYSGSPVSYDSQFGLGGIPAGEYTLAVAIVDTTKGNAPGLSLAIDGNDLTEDGWTRLGEVKVK